MYHRTIMDTLDHRTIILKILNYIEKKDLRNGAKGNRHYTWIHVDFDDQQTNFEYLSTKEIIGFTTSLEGDYVGVLMSLFQSLFDHNCWKVDDMMMEEKCNLLEQSGRKLYRLYKKSVGIKGVGENVRVAKDPPIVYDYKLLRDLLLLE